MDKEVQAVPVGLLGNRDVWSDRHKAVALYFDELALTVPDACAFTNREVQYAN